MVIYPLAVIAECIETASELQTLRELDVRYGQGFYLARPAPASDLPHVLRRAAGGFGPGRLTRLRRREDFAPLLHRLRTTVA